MRIANFTMYSESASSWYRSNGVIPKLELLNDKIKTKLLSEVTWTQLSDSDILFILNPYKYEMLIGCTMAKEYGLKLWIDYDDDYLNIPLSHPESKFFNDYNTKEIIWKSLVMADLVTVSTESIKNSFSEFNKNIHIIPNAFNDYNYKLFEKVSGNKIISWRGGNTHFDDLRTVDLKLISEKYLDWQWVFMTDENNVKHIMADIPQSICSGWMQQLDYHRYLKTLNPSIIIHPLVDNKFNQGKSNISFIEGTSAGAVSVMPEINEFSKENSGIINYENNIEFLNVMSNIIDSEKLRNDIFKISKQYIIDNLLLSNVNKKRLEAIQTIM